MSKNKNMMLILACSIIFFLPFSFVNAQKDIAQKDITIDKRENIITGQSKIIMSPLCPVKDLERLSELDKEQIKDNIIQSNPSYKIDRNDIEVGESGYTSVKLGDLIVTYTPNLVARKLNYPSKTLVLNDTSLTKEEKKTILYKIADANKNETNMGQFVFIDSDGIALGDDEPLDLRFEKRKVFQVAITDIGDTYIFEVNIQKNIIDKKEVYEIKKRPIVKLRTDQVIEVLASPKPVYVESLDYINKNTKEKIYYNLLDSNRKIDPNNLDVEIDKKGAMTVFYNGDRDIKRLIAVYPASKTVTNKEYRIWQWIDDQNRKEWMEKISK